MASTSYAVSMTDRLSSIGNRDSEVSLSFDYAIRGVWTIQSISHCTNTLCGRINVDIGIVLWFYVYEVVSVKSLRKCVHACCSLTIACFVDLNVFNNVVFTYADTKIHWQLRVPALASNVYICCSRPPTRCTCTVSTSGLSMTCLNTPSLCIV